MFNPFVFSDVAFAVTLASVVDFAVGFCVGITGEVEGVGVDEFPGGAGVDELRGGAGGETAGGEEDEGTEGGGDVDLGGVLSTGGGAD